MNALVAGNGSYIVRPCGHDLHSPTVGIKGVGVVGSRDGVHRVKGWWSQGLGRSRG